MASKSFGNKLISNLAKIAPNTLLINLERSAAFAQGKGWGSSTVDEETRICLSLMSPLTKKGPIVLDVGANKGLWSESLLKQVPEATVYAFEPSATARLTLQAIEKREVGFSVQPYALGRNTGHGTLWADQPGSGLASLTQRRMDHFNTEFTHSEGVEILTLDSWASSSGVIPSLIKLDVEGHELDVLLGGEAVVPRVEVIQFEFGGCNIDTRTYFQDFFYYFKDHRFSLFRHGPKGLCPINEYKESEESFQTTNYFAVNQRS